MATAAKRQPALPAALSRELDQLARREGKTRVAVFQDLVSEKKHNRLEQEFRAIQGYWSKKANAKGILTKRIKGVGSLYLHMLTVHSRSSRNRW